MNSPGTYIERPKATLKEAYALLVKACGGFVRAAAASRVEKSQMERYTLEAYPDCHMPADVVMSLEMHCREPIITRFLALATGHVLLPTTAKDDAPLAQDLAFVGHEMARLFEKVAAAMADGKIQTAEAAQIEAVAMDGINALVSVVAETRRIRRGGAT